MLHAFFKHVPSSEEDHHPLPAHTDRLANSFAQDLVFAIYKGTFLTLKHTSVGLGLHRLIGQILPLTILLKLGHSISYASGYSRFADWIIQMGIF